MCLPVVRGLIIKNVFQAVKPEKNVLLNNCEEKAMMKQFRFRSVNNNNQASWMLCLWLFKLVKITKTIKPDQVNLYAMFYTTVVFVLYTYIIVKGTTIAYEIIHKYVQKCPHLVSSSYKLKKEIEMTEFYDIYNQLWPYVYLFYFITLLSLSLLLSLYIYTLYIHQHPLVKWKVLWTGNATF